MNHETPSPYCYWLPEYSVGHEIVDEQHKKIFSMINELHAAISCEDENTIIKRVLDEMADYIEYHFDTEKSYLKDMPEFTGHERKHWEFTQRTLQFATEYYRQPRKEILYDIVSFLSYWLKDHIKRTDIDQFKLYYQRLNSKSMKASPDNSKKNDDEKRL
jgi:hemerythrin